ncbi:hypothetical protein [Dyadobacter luticola]|uniref:ZU5 domain-containing protein n=1 Tax=Dyadobacter luticola TaxID=1979387 RepID=A0A5R9KVX6_9BACT|nr:hypothetical protein [Dyadobacter luticola]TLV00432.1 hypothetical protein FEN17_13160 [Dyadobacter luticola]
MKNNFRKSIFSIAWAIACLAACSQKDEDSSPEPQPSTSATVTEIGQPQGVASSKSIGPEGGEISSSDGLVTLTIPAGALTSTTNITIQPISNQSPNGLGLAYRFSPDGTQFAKDAKLVFQYNADSVAVNDAQMLGVGFQQADRRWQRAANIEVDTLNRLISVAMPHFSDWSAYELEQIEGAGIEGSQALELNQSADLLLNEALLIVPLDQDPSKSLTFKDAKWSVVGGSANGTVTFKKGALATYTAPGKTPPQNPITVELEITFKNSPKKVFLRKRILIGGDYFYGTFDGQPFNWTQTNCILKNGQVIMTGTDESFTQSLNIILQSADPEALLGFYPYKQGIMAGGAWGEFAVSYLTHNGYISVNTPCMARKPMISGGGVTITGFDEVGGTYYIKGSLTGTYFRLAGDRCPGAEFLSAPIQGQFRLAVIKQ